MSGRRRVLLYNPRSDYPSMPLGLLAVASALDHSRFEAHIVDARLEPRPHERLLAEILPGTVCVGMSVLTGAPLGDALAAARTIKRRHPELPIVWGGWHPSLFPTECLADPAVDYTVQGQGEVSFAELVARLAGGRANSGLAGCAWRDTHDRPRQGPPRPALDIRALPEPDYGLLDVEAYFARKGRRQLDLVASQGCYWRCAFCADPAVYQRGWSGLDPSELALRASTLAERFGFTDLAFLDETFFTHVERALDFADRWCRQERQITWTATLRADQGERLSDAQMALLARSGLRRVLVGVEAGSQAMLDWLKKDIRLPQVMGTAEKLRRHGIAGDFPFIVGLPGESEASVNAALAWARRLRAMSPGFQTPIFFYRPYPGSPITAAAEAAGCRLPDSLEAWAEFDLFGPGPWVAPALSRRIAREAFYLRQAWDRPPRAWKLPLQRLARLRLARGTYGLPIEWHLARRLGHRAELL